MLKIKDNVDLKELEKFGFELDKYNKYVKSKKIIIPCYCYSCENGNTNHSKEELINGFYVENVEKNRMIYKVGYGGKHSYWRNEFTSEDYNTLYDLIKADLVEKIEK